MKRHLQIMPALDEGTLAALRASIQRHGVKLPVIRDQYGRIIDGHHRVAIAEELGVDYPVEIIEVKDDDHAFELAGTLNLARRHLDHEQRRTLAADLRADRHSIRSIAKALGVDPKQIRRDLAQVGTVSPPETVTGIDGKAYSHPNAYEALDDDAETAHWLSKGRLPPPVSKPAANVVAGDSVTDDHGDEREVEHVETIDGEVVLFDEEGEAIIVHPDHEVEVRPRVSKPDVGGGVSHPARFSLGLLPVFAAAVPVAQYPRVLDPFAGTGRIHELANRTVGLELESEWAGLHPDTLRGDALHLPFRENCFDAIVTSPTYGNRLADRHDAKDGSLRRSYTHDLGRKLTAGNSGGMQWGQGYRDFHTQAWEQAWHVLRPGGRLVLNVKDHDRRFTRQHVAAWHVSTLWTLGFELVWFDQLDAGGLHQGENAEDRYPEQIFVLDKP